MITNVDTSDIAYANESHLIVALKKAEVGSHSFFKVRLITGGYGWGRTSLKCFPSTG